MSTRTKNPPKAHKALRRMKKELVPFTNMNGRITYLNPAKHLMLNKPYTNPEYQNVMIEYARQQFKMRKQRETYKNQEVDKETQKEDNVENDKEESDA